MAAERATIPYLERLRPVDINNTAVKIYQINKKINRMKFCVVLLEILGRF